MGVRSRLVGRDADLRRVEDARSQAALITITGPGGVGKTRLALESIIGVDALVVELADLPVGVDVTSVCGQVGYESPEAAATALREMGSTLVLDSCEHVLGAAAAFAERFLADERAPTVLATSREPLGCVGERLIALEPLSIDDAAELFIDRSTSAGASWDRSSSTTNAVRSLCARLDGLPLAIELAAARSRAFAPGTLLELVGDGLDVLHGVRAAIDLSIRLLDDDERRGFAALGVFAGTFDVELVQAQLGLDDRLQAIDLVARLVDRSLVAPAHHGGSARYRLLELLRDHAAAMLAQEGRWIAEKDRFAEAMVGIADRIVVDGVAGWTGELLLRVDTHLRNLLAAIEWCIDNDAHPGRAYRLMLPLFASVHHGRASEVLATGARVLRQWPEPGHRGRAEAMAVVANAAVVSGDLVRAEELGRAALDDPARTTIAELIAERALGFACRGSGALAAASEHIARGRVAANVLGARSFGRELAGFEGSVLVLDGDPDGALSLLAPVTEEAVAVGDRVTEAWLRLVTAVALARADRWEDARTQVAAARAAADALDYPWWSAAILRMEASLAEHWSPERWSAAIDFGAAQGAAGEVAITLRAAAATAMHHGRHELADALFAAVPVARDVTVLPDLFPGEISLLEARRRGTPPLDLLASVETARRVLATEPAVTEVRPARSRASAVVREGDVWALTHAGTTARVRDLKGIGDLVRLLSRPGVDIHCLELIGGSDLGGTGPALDERARRAYEARIRSLQTDVDEARDANDWVRAERAELELDALVSQLTQAFGLGGRARATSSAAERARSAVTYRVRTAIKRIAEVHPELGRHLDNAVRTGTWCSYRPETDVVWELAQADSL